jgi:hypothetical protein
MQSRNKNMSGDKKIYNDMNKNIYRMNVDDNIMLPVTLANNSPYLLQGQINSLSRPIDTESILFGISQSDVNMPKIINQTYYAPKYGVKRNPNIVCPDLTIYERYRPT